MIFVIGFVVASITYATENYDVSEKKSQSIRLMTFNVRREGSEKYPERQWQARLVLIKECIEKLQPDIIGLQEATQKQVDDLQVALPEFAYVGQGRGKSWWGLAKDEYTPIFYKKERFALRDHGTFKLNEQNSLIRWASQLRKNGFLPRICTWVKLYDTNNAAEFLVYNTHLDHDFPEARRAEIAVIKQKIEGNSNDIPLVLMGDFNAEFDGDIKNVLSEFRHAKDIALKVEGPHETRTGWDEKELKWIDHILVKKNEQKPISVEYYAVIQKTTDQYPSDHRPVIVDLTINERDNQEKFDECELDND